MALVPYVPSYARVSPSYTAGQIVTVATVADLRALKTPYPSVYLEGYWTRGDGGGGELVYNAASTAADDGGLTFAPACDGRYIRIVDGIVHCRWFGLYHSPTVDQSERMQAFLWSLCVPGAFPNRSYLGWLDPGVYNCAGKTLYLERNGPGETPPTAFVQNNAQLEGSSRRNAVIRDVNLVVGTARWKNFGASGFIRLANFRVEGRVHYQNIEANSLIDNVTLARSTIDTMASPMDPDFPDYLIGSFSNGVAGDMYLGAAKTITGIALGNPTVITVSATHYYQNGQTVFLDDIIGVAGGAGPPPPTKDGTILNGGTFTVTVTSPTSFSIAVDSTAYTAYASGGTSRVGTTWKAWASNHISTIYAANHPLFINYGFAGKAGTGVPSGDYLKGFLIHGTANLRLVHGTAFGCDPAILITGSSGPIQVDHMKFEECEGIHIDVQGGSSHVLSGYHRYGVGHDLVSPLVRLGKQGKATPRDVTVRNALFLNDQDDTIKNISAITQANPGQITLTTAHGWINGDYIRLYDIDGMTALNGLTVPVTVVDTTNITIGVDTTGFDPYTGMGKGQRVTPHGRAIYVEQCQGVTIDENYFEAFDTTIDVRNGGGGVASVTVGERNRFSPATPTRINWHDQASAQSDRLPTGSTTRVAALGTATSVTWDVTRGAKAWINLSTATGRTITGPVNMVPGMQPARLVVVKGNAGSSVTWATTIKWAGGSAPDFSAMTTSQRGMVTVECYDVGSGPELFGSFDIRG